MELKKDMRWDYDAGWYYLDANDINDFLNDHAKNGWELMAIENHKETVFCVFRRQVYSERVMEWNRRHAEAYRIKGARDE